MASVHLCIFWSQSFALFSLMLRASMVKTFLDTPRRQEQICGNARRVLRGADSFEASFPCSWRGVASLSAALMRRQKHMLLHCLHHAVIPVPWLATLLSGAGIGFLSRMLVLVRFWGTRVGMARVPDDVSVDRLVRWMFVICCGFLFLGLVAMLIQAYSSSLGCIQLLCREDLHPEPAQVEASNFLVIMISWELPEAWVPRYWADVWAGCIWHCQVAQFLTSAIFGVFTAAGLQVGLWHWWCGCFNEHVRKQTPMHWEMRRAARAMGRRQWLSPA